MTFEEQLEQQIKETIQELVEDTQHRIINRYITKAQGEVREAIYKGVGKLGVTLASELSIERKGMDLHIIIHNEVKK